MTRIDRRSLSLLRLATMLSPPFAFAADYPTRPVHLIVGFTPGASSDIVARLYAKGARITKNWRSARPWQQLFSWPLKKQTIK